MTDQAIQALTPVVGVRAGCTAVGESQARYYRRHRKSPPPAKPERLPKPQPRALSDYERKEVLNVMNCEEYVDESPWTIYHRELDRGNYLASVPTMYRILRAVDQVKERRRVASHPAKVKPELVATKPNDVWSWDITKLLGPQKWTYFYLYVIIDIFSRYVVGWMLARAENAQLAKVLIRQAVTNQCISPDQLTLHSDNGSPMTAKPFAFLLADLGVAKSYSRPHTSNDNPYSEAQFRTLKYRPDFPNRFGSYEDALDFCRRFFHWYSYLHLHSGIGFHTPADVHYGRALAIQEKRQTVLDGAYAAHPERFVHKPPVPLEIPAVAWINEPGKEAPSTQ